MVSLAWLIMHIVLIICKNTFKHISGITTFPAIGLFRNGQFLEYEDDENDEKAVLKWMTAEETLKIIGIIDEVRIKRFKTVLQCISK
jgi:hypothetical protein